METLELSDIQGYIIRGYKYMQFSRYAVLRVSDPVAARKFLQDQAGEVTNVTHHAKTTCLNIAFTCAGLSALGLKNANLAFFTREFREGITSEHRQRLLGDMGDSAPEAWCWGGTNNQPVHMLLMVFGKDEPTALSYYEKLRAEFASGFDKLLELDGLTLPHNREHFGFRDGISQPIIKGSGRKGPENDFINAGEFLMGYKNEYDVYPDTPLLGEDQGDSFILPFDVAGTGKKDLGRNGSYMVMRQMQQDVKGYWEFMNEKTKNEDGSVNELESVKLASKMMGRWPSGAPVVKFPDRDPGGDSNDDYFTYSDLDKEGMKCPFGSHLRRTNPRDTFEDNGPKESLRLTKRHRIMRRARLYGEPCMGSPLDCSPKGEVGMIFTCFNTDISRQFEFIQYTWANYPKFMQLYNDPDPVCGVKHDPGPGVEQNFTIQAEPVNKYVTGLKRFVTVRGGAYFFFPSVTTIRYLGTL